MARFNQPDLFAEPEPDLLTDAPPVTYRPEPDKVRARLNHILAEARAAATLPWDRSRTNLYRTIVPQMTLWLPDDEAAQWRLASEAEMARFDEAGADEHACLETTAEADGLDGAASTPTLMEDARSPHRVAFG